MSKAGELRTPGVIRVLSGRLLDLNRLEPDDIHIEDIAWGLGRTLRYGGHIRQNYTVAMHSVIASYYVPDEYKLEALLHDAAEGYIGDIIWPVKALFPEIENWENRIAYKIMQKFGVDCQSEPCIQEGGEDVSRVMGRIYKKSPVIENIDRKLLQHECFEMGRPGVYDQGVEDAWWEAAQTHVTWWHESAYAFLERFYQLTAGEPELTRERLDYLTKLWFPDEGETSVADAERAMQALEGAAEYLIPNSKPFLPAEK